MDNYKWERCTHDQIISNSPCKLSAIIISSDDVGAADITLYDGESTNDPQLITFHVWKGMTHDFAFPKPLKTLRGLYIDIGSNVEEVLILYEWGKE